jgi:nitrous oxidase accessory protein NosD
MNARCFSVLLALALFATATTAEAAVHRVFPGDSIQAAIDAASPGDTILVEPGVYEETGNADFGLHITTDNLRLIGKTKKGQGEAGKVRVVKFGTQKTGVYAAPAGCGPGVGVGECDEDNLQGFYIRGFTVEDFPGNGIQTRFVNDFKIIRNESVRNLDNGIYPTISVNGLVQNNISYGSLDTAMWVAASENVRVIGNDLSESVIGLEISVSNNVWVKHNDIYDNTVGVGLFHPNAAGNAQLPVMENWVIQHNNVYDNNRPNEAPPTSFQGGLPPGVGVLLLGVSEHVIAKNTVENNDFVGIAVLGWCSATATNPLRNCVVDPPQADPAANNNLVSQNKVSGNGGMPPTEPPFDVISFLAADITYFEQEGSSGNCFNKNKPSDFTFVSSEPDGELPTDGC